MSTDVRVYEDLETLSQAAADLIASELSESKGEFVLGLSGGETPKRTYELLAGMRGVEWANVHIVWSDERFVPPNDDRSNEHMARRALLDRVPIPPENIHPIWRGLPLQDTASAYQHLLDRLGAIDLLLLGMGSDGHTASLFPGSPVLNEITCSVAPVRIDSGVDRVTLTAPTINAAKKIVFLVSGESKASVLRDVLYGDHDPLRLPTQLITIHSDPVFLIDRAASKLLG